MIQDPGNVMQDPRTRATSERQRQRERQNCSAQCCSHGTRCGFRGSHHNSTDCIEIMMIPLEQGGLTP
eukprot:5739458-Pyramimonas_sp.AAC.1